MTTQPKLILCPYCGNAQTAPEDRCAGCGGFFDPLSLKVTQQHMGPWFIRDRNAPFRPGCSYEVLVKQIEKGKVKATTILRGPTTRQFWSVARNVPGVAHLLGYCHACGAHCQKTDENCSECGEVFFAPKLRDNLGLAPLGSDISTRTTLSGTGSYPAMVAAGTGPARPAVAPARVPPISDPPVGSAILAGLRTDGSPMGDTPVSSPAASSARTTPDALSWLTSSEESEPDALATADRTAPVQRSRTAGTWTWVLVGVNALLLAVLIGAAVIIIGGGDSNQPTTPDPAQSTDEPTSPAEPAGSSEQPSPPAAQPVDEIADPNPVDASGQPQPPATPATGEQPVFNDEGPADDAAIARQRYVEQFNEARQLSRDGQLKEALALLQKIKAAPRDQRPEGLDAAIEQVQKKIRDRDLESFFE